MEQIELVVQMDEDTLDDIKYSVLMSKDLPQKKVRSILSIIAGGVPISKGEWKPITRYIYKCGSCGQTNDYKMNYCPHCGAKMEGAEE